MYGKRTDEIAAFLDDVVDGADALVVQGGINDVAQGRSVVDAARDLAGIVERGRRLGLPVALADVLPWPNGDARAAAEIVRLNELVHAIGGVTHLAVPRHARGDRRLERRRRPPVRRGPPPARRARLQISVVSPS